MQSMLPGNRLHWMLLMRPFLRATARDQGDRKGSPLLYDGSARQARSSIVGAIPCGRPGGVSCSVSDTIKGIVNILTYWKARVWIHLVNNRIMLRSMKIGNGRHGNMHANGGA